MTDSTRARNTDFARWIRKKAWTVEQAALLLSRIDPDNFEPSEGFYEYPPMGVPARAIYPDATLSWLRLIEDGCIRKELDLANNRLPPSAWLKWAKERCAVSVPSFFARTTINASQQMPQKLRKGPKPGTLKRYDEADRALFPVIKEMVGRGESVTKVCLKLAEEGKVVGDGAPQSKADRLRKLFSKSHDPIRS